jgi:hypothetical protein
MCSLLTISHHRIHKQRLSKVDRFQAVASGGVESEERFGLIEFAFTQYLQYPTRNSTTSLLCLPCYQLSGRPGSEQVGLGQR